MIIYSASGACLGTDDSQSATSFFTLKQEKMNYPTQVTMPIAHYNDFRQPHLFVLIVDDDQFISALLADLLHEAGYRVKVAHDGNEAYLAACQETPALILTDYMMPICDGVRLTQLIRKNPNTSAIPIVMMSSARPRLPGLEDVPFLPKPFDIDDVIAFVERHTLPPQYLHGKD